MNSQLEIHPKTLEQLESFNTSPSHAVLLSGPKGSGKLTVAKLLAKEVLGIAGAVERYPYLLHLGADKSNSVGIEAIRQIEHFLSLKVPRSNNYNRIIIIENCQIMTLEAQNSLLKTLEEPPKDTLIILTVDNKQTLLPTIISRVQHIQVKSPSQERLTAHFTALGSSETDINRANIMSSGLPGLMSAILSDSEHPLLIATERARQLLAQTTYERLLAVDELTKNRPLLDDVLFILQQMAHIRLQKTTGSAAQQWQCVLSATYEASVALANSAQPKLTLTKLMNSL